MAFQVRVGAAQAVPEVSLVAPSACLVGERLPVRCVVSTSGAPLCSATLSFDLQCNGPDDSQCPELLLKDSLAGVSKAGNPLAAGDAVSGTLALPRVLRGQPLVLELTMPASQVRHPPLVSQWQCRIGLPAR